MINLRNREVCYLTEDNNVFFLNCFKLPFHEGQARVYNLSAEFLESGCPQEALGQAVLRGAPPMTFFLTELNVTLLGLEFRSQPLTLLANNKVNLPEAQLVV